MPPKKKAEPEPQVDPLEGLSDGNANDFVATLLEDAQALRNEKTDLLQRIDDNRQTLRRIARTGHLSEKQSAAIALWYPERKKGEEENGEEQEKASENGAAA